MSVSLNRNLSAGNNKAILGVDGNLALSSDVDTGEDRPVARENRESSGRDQYPINDEDAELSIQTNIHVVSKRVGKSSFDLEGRMENDEIGSDLIDEVNSHTLNSDKSSNISAEYCYVRRRDVIEQTRLSHSTSNFNFPSRRHLTAVSSSRESSTSQQTTLATPTHYSEDSASLSSQNIHIPETGAAFLAAKSATTVFENSTRVAGTTTQPEFDSNDKIEGAAKKFIGEYFSSSSNSPSQFTI